MTITTKSEYEIMYMDNLCYPRAIITNGTVINQVYDGDNVDNVPDGYSKIDRLLCADEFASYAEISRRRKLVKKGLRGEDLNDAINGYY